MRHRLNTDENTFYPQMAQISADTTGRNLICGVLRNLRTLYLWFICENLWFKRLIQECRQRTRRARRFALCVEADFKRATPRFHGQLERDAHAVRVVRHGDG